MPELPEVEVVRRGLLGPLTGRTLTGLESSGKKLRSTVPVQEMKHALVGGTVSQVRRRAKYLLLDFDTGATLVLHLGMTGRLGIFDRQQPKRPHDHVYFLLDDQTELRFNDVRRFGSITLLPANTDGEAEAAFFNGWGPEPFDQSFSSTYLYERSRGRTLPVKNFIMDGRIVVGVGNIYANESLFLAGLRPDRPSGKVGRRKWQTLVEQIRKVLEYAISCGGSTINDFIGADGEHGYFQVNFTVYGRAGLPCTICSTPIRQLRLGGRSAFFCPKCQH